jgi:hypothetical protein
MTDRTAIYAAIDEERQYQDAKYGTPEERALSIIEYLYIMSHEKREAREEAMFGKTAAALCELLQAVAVGVACLERHGVVTRSDMEKRIQT